MIHSTQTRRAGVELLGMGEVLDVFDETCRRVKENGDVTCMSAWLHATGPIRGAAQPRLSGTALSEAEALEDFLHAHMQSTIASASATDRMPVDTIIWHHRSKSVFGLTSVVYDGTEIGVLALCKQTGPDIEAELTPRWVSVAKYVSLVVGQSLKHQQLEVDFAEMTQRVSSLARDVEIDPLTRVENKISFETKCQARLTASKRPAALLALDLDDFKAVNDVYGHQFGDVFLKTICKALKSELPPTSIIGRTGGDEFCVLLEMPSAGRSYISSIVQSAQLAIRRNIATLGKPGLGEVSIGISMYPQQAQTFERLMEMADCALYESKKTDRNAVTTYAPRLETMKDHASLRQDPIEVFLDRVTTHFQPLYDLETLELTGVEVLTRCRSDRGELIYPDRFCWAFTDERFGGRLTLHIVATAFAELQTNGSDLMSHIPTFWINVTDKDLRDPDFLFDLQSILSANGIEWDRIVLEVNENSFLGERNGPAYHALAEIRARGGRVALDDFGVGQIGLVHLCQWPVDVVKIDRSIIQKTAQDPRALVVVEALVTLAQKFDQCIVAEGVEDQSEIAHFASLGCTLAQGFGLARPMDAINLAKSMQHDNALVRASLPAQNHRRAGCNRIAFNNTSQLE